jgi:hypothetical protein
MSAREEKAATRQYMSQRDRPGASLLGGEGFIISAMT